MEHYGKPADLAYVMQQWVRAMIGAGCSFHQQLDPLTGRFSTEDPGGYSPAALVLLDYVWRLHGVRGSGDFLEWNCRCPENCGTATFSIQTSHGSALLQHTKMESLLTLADKTILKVEGTARVLTDARGRVTRIVGTHDKTADVRLSWPSGKSELLQVAPNSARPAAPLG